MSTMINLENTAQEHRNFFFLIRLILMVLVGGLCVFELFVNFRGLEAPAAMDQAQIARRIARGEGFTSQNMRPLDIMSQAANLPKDEKLDFNHFRETNYAPLHPYVLALPLKLAGYDKFEKHRMDSEVSNVYNGDRWVAGTSMVFFVLSLALVYVIFSRLFDEVLASTVVAFLGLSELMLQYAVSGLAQPMLMCLLLGTIAAFMQTVRAYNRGYSGRTMLWCVVAFILLALMGLASYLAMWCALGFIIFCGLYFRPYGLYAAVGAAVIALFNLLPTYLLLQPTGGVVPNILHAVFYSFGSDTGDMLLRATSDSALSFNSSAFFTRLLGYMFGQCGTLFHDMGGIIVTPFFFLALFNRYKNRTTEGVKWAVFGMWLCCCIGMALFGEKGEVVPSQLAIIFTPFFAAFGTALVFNFLARLQLGAAFRGYRALTIVALLVISSGAFMFELPMKMHIGILTSARGIPHFPPYYPPAFNGKLYDMTNADDIIVTDQPWAVAWYADRKAVWLPTSVDAYARDLEPIFNKSKQGVQGFLITPSSHTMPEKGITGVIAQAGDFAPLALEGKLLLLSPKHNLAFTELFNTESQTSTKPLASLVSSQGQFSHRNFLLGTEMVYYSKDEVQTPEPAKKK